MKKMSSSMLDVTKKFEGLNENSKKWVDLAVPIVVSGNIYTNIKNGNQELFRKMLVCYAYALEKSTNAGNESEIRSGSWIEKLTDSSLCDE